ncbi:MAG: HIT family protein [Bacteroidales bacterium]|nr:HIT family protein [Bacteroidales bacterium]
MASIFSRIVAGEIPCYKVAETDDCLAFLDVNPVVRGHVLCIPKKEVDYIFDLDEKLYVDLQLFSRKVAIALKKVCPCIKVAVAVQGLEVPHAHIHLMPLNDPSEFGFGHHIKMEPAEMQALAAKIAAAIE